MVLTQAGNLLLGLPYRGQLYYEVTVKPMTMGGECLALETIAGLDLPQKTPKTVANMLVEFAYLAEQLEVTGIPKEALTPHYLLEHLTTDDYALITELILALRKKRQLAGEAPSQA